MSSMHQRHGQTGITSIDVTSIQSGEILSEREEKLLQKYFDHEHNWYEGVWARLILRKKSAQEFIHTMETIRELAHAETSAPCLAKYPPVDLWDAINARIEEEERAALYLGKRTSEEQKTGHPWRSLLFSDRIAWGGIGGAVAACVTYVMVSGVTSPQPDLYASATQVSPQVVMREQAERIEVSPLQNVGLLNSSGQESLSVKETSVYSAPSRLAVRRYSRGEGSALQQQEMLAFSSQSSRTQSSRAQSSGIQSSGVGSLTRSRSRYSIPTAVEVDWMRSEGRVSMLQDTNERSPVIWVKKREPSSYLSFLSRYKSSSSGMQQNVPRQNQAPLVVYPDRAPQGIPVVNYP